MSTSLGGAAVQGMDALGAIAGLGASALWVVSSLSFTAAGARLGATAVNALRLGLALTVLFGVNWVWSGSAMPTASERQLWSLAISGVIGLAICDQALFIAFMDLGPRRALLMMTTAPLWALTFGAVMLGERLAPHQLFGIGLAIAGIVLVILERREPASAAARTGRELRGWMLAGLAGLLQAVGSLLSKRGMAPEGGEAAVAPLTAALIRMAFGVLGVLPIVAWAWRSAARRREASDGAEQRLSGAPVESPLTANPRLVHGLLFTALGTLVGPVLGVLCLMVANDRLHLGIAGVLTSLTPVLIVPVAATVMRERIPPLGWVGALIATLGVATLFLNDIRHALGV